MNFQRERDSIGYRAYESHLLANASIGRGRELVFARCCHSCASLRLIETTVQALENCAIDVGLWIGFALTVA